jgi:tRNA 5-methylaminomethyl-2-thiouridine biosynthesis bifunctional protein
MDIALLWRGRQRFVLFDAAYGDGQRFEQILAAWRADPQRCEHLHYIAFTDDWLPGARRLPQRDARITLDLLTPPRGETRGATTGEAPDQAQSQSMCQAQIHMLSQLRVRIGAVFADNLVPELIAPLTRNLAHGAQLIGASLSEAQRQASALAGFSETGAYSSRNPRASTPHAHEPAPHARANAHTHAPDAHPHEPAPHARANAHAPAPDAHARRAIVLGAGLAGAAACERLCARGWDVTLVERHPQMAMEASGNLAGVYMPLLALDDNPTARLSRAAYRYALAYWEQLGGIGAVIEGDACGVLQLARSDAHAAQQRRIAARHQYPRDFAEWREAGDAGRYAPHGAWLFPQGGWARPASVCAVMLAACADRLHQRFGVGDTTLAYLDGQWQVRDVDGATVAQAPTLVLANGDGARTLAQSAHLPLAALRGQVTHLEPATLPPVPTVLCGEGYLTPASHGLCSAGASYELDADPHLRADSQQANLARLAAMLGQPDLLHAQPLRGRVGFRSVAPDRLPLVGAMPVADTDARIERLRDVPRQPGLYALLGYASRGLIWAPLAAELLAAQLDGEPLPLEAALLDALDPGRFLRRARTR